MEKLILRNMMYNEKYVRGSLAFLKGEYFGEKELEILFTVISDFLQKYNAQPTKESLIISIDNNKNLSERNVEIVKSLIDELEKEKDKEENLEWLLDETEKWIQERAIHLALLESINIIEDNQPKGGIPQILTDALSVSFDTRVGHNYIEDAESRYEFYMKKEEKIPFYMEMLDKVTGGGIENKTLNVVLAGTGIGKTIFLCNYAANCLQNGKNVLYITMEMAEERIAERIDANLLDIPISSISNIGKKSFMDRITRLKAKTLGELYIKEYPTSGGNANIFRHLIEEIKMKKNFVPKVILIDYINICSSIRMKSGGENSYGYIKAIAEELRGLGCEYNIPIFTATQTNKSGYNNSDIDLTNTAESMGLTHTADFIIGIISTEELTQSNQVMIKQLKSRYGDKANYTKFLMGLDRAKMKFYDLENSSVNSQNEQSEDQHGYTKKQLDEIDKDFFGINDSKKEKKTKKFKGFKMSY